MNTLINIFASVLGIPKESVVSTLSNAIILVTEIEKAFSLSFTFDEAMSVKDFGGAVSLLTAKGAVLHE
jgi:acyl carrier protein